MVPIYRWEHGGVQELIQGYTVGGADSTETQGDELESQHSRTAAASSGSCVILLAHFFTWEGRGAHQVMLHAQSVTGLRG